MSTLQNRSIPSLPNLHLRGHFRKLAHYFRPHLHGIIVIIPPIYTPIQQFYRDRCKPREKERERGRERDS